jgi:CheY-like chemotaxis protein
MLADPNALELALINLTVNARDAMPEGRGKLWVTAANVTVGKGRRDDLDIVGDFVAVAVRDNGSGIPPDDLAHIFEPFFTTKPTGKGTGLGLSQVYGFVKQSDGAVTVTSKLGEGTTFTLYLPRSREALQPAAAKGPAASPKADGRLLLVEDDPMVADMVHDMMRSVGYEVVGVESGEAALALVEAGEAFDAVLSDVLMAGGLSGLELAARLRTLRPGLPIVLMTGFSEALAGGQAQGWTLLTKPFGVAQATAALDRARQEAKIARQAAQ